MTDLEKRAEEYAITYGIGDNFNVSDYIKFAVKFAQQETDLLSKHILELQKDKGSLTDQLTEAKKIIYDLLQIGVFQFPFQDEEANYLNKQITTKAEAFIKE